MGKSRYDKFSKMVQEYRGAMESQGQIKAMQANANRIADLEEKSFNADLTIKEAKLDRKASKAETIKRQAEMDKVMNELMAQTITNIRDNMSKLASNAASEAAKNIVSGGN